MTPEALATLLTLTGLEIVLGIDNIIFVSIMAGKLPRYQRGTARVIGLAMAMLARIGLLFSLSFLMGMTAPLFAVFGNPVSGRDIILVGGGLFLVVKSVFEILEKFGGQAKRTFAGHASTFARVIVQIMLIDIVFSLDSIITAVGMARDLPVMIIAVVIAVAFMMFFSGAVGNFIDNNPSIKILALSFLVLIGIALVAEGLGLAIPKGYVYFAMAFSFAVEMLNIRLRQQAPGIGRGGTEDCDCGGNGS